MLRVIIFFIAISYGVILYIITGRINTTYDNGRLATNLFTLLYIIMFLYSLGYTLFSTFRWIDAYRKMHNLNRYIWSRNFRRGILGMGLLVISFVIFIFIIDFFTVKFVHPPYPPLPPEAYHYDRTLN